MVQGQDERVVVRGQADEPGPQQRAACQVERPGEVFGQQPLQVRRAGDVGDRQREPPRLPHDLARSSVDGRERGAQ